MQIDGFTVIAQIFNFLVLAVLLRLVLYKPITKAMADRASAIETRWAEAESAKAEAKAESTKHRMALENLNAERAALLTAARQEAEEGHRRLLEQSRLEAKQAQQEWRADLQREQADFALELRQQVASRICSVAKRALVDLADARLEAQILAVFIDQVREMDPADRRAMGSACRDGGLAVVMQTGYAVGDEVRKDLDQVIISLLSDESVGDDLSVEWSVHPELGCGVQLETPGRQVRWSIDSYVDEVENEVMESLRVGAAII